MEIDEERLQRLLGDPALQPLVDRLHRHLSHGELPGRLRFQDPGTDLLGAVSRLLGRRFRSAGSLTLDTAELERLLRNADIAPDLPTAISALRGPIVDRRAEKQRERESWELVITSYADPPQAAGWLADLEQSGLLKRLAGRDPETGGRLLRQTLAVLDQLPARDRPLSTLAAHTLGDAHALDEGQAVRTLVLRALQRIHGQVETPQLWERAGILPGGGLNSTVLTFMLPPISEAPNAWLTTGPNAQAQPCNLTLRQLRHWHASTPLWALDGRAVFVVENPTPVAEAAIQLGTGCAPMVCTGGRPNAALHTLLEQLNTDGARLYYHGDFDWTGLAIGNQVIGRHRAVPWRFGAVDYQRLGNTSKPLNGKPVDACWDERLRPRMQANGYAVDEERDIAGMLDDLSVPSSK